MKLAIDYYPFLNFYHAGPKVFLNRLSNSIIKNNFCKIRSPYLPFYDVALYSVYHKNFFNKKFVLRVDGIYFDKKNTAGDTYKLNKNIFDSIDKALGVIFISEFSKKMVEKFHGKLTIPNTVIHNKVPLDLFNSKGSNYRYKLGISKDDKVLITSAHWRKHKRLNETIKLLNLINVKSTNEYKLIVLGDNSKKNLGKNIFNVGDISPSELSPWYRTANIYIHLAWIEPCGNTQIEAMASGLPVVCCNNGGIGETVINANGGIVVKSDADYEYNLIDYYNSPEPDYSKLIDSIELIFGDLNLYKNKINYDEINIDLAAKKYVDFISSL
jgi:glycosyltransferase involved in cell wall biosynthesis